MKKLISAIIVLIMIFALLPAGAALPYDEADALVDLSACSDTDAAELAASIAADYPGARIVELRDVEGNSTWTLEQILALREALPDTVELRCGFELFGTYVDSDMEEIYYKRIGIHDSDLDTVRAALPLLTACKRFVLDYCGPTYEALAALRDEFPEKGIVWRVNLDGVDSLLTDDTVLWTNAVTDKNSDVLKYCTALEVIDIGHDHAISRVDFAAYMPNLKVFIIADTEVRDIAPLANCTELEYLEMFYLLNVKDLSPLASCTKLEHLNICTLQSVKDLSPLYGLKNLKRLWMMNMHSIKKGSNSYQLQEIKEMLPDCEIIQADSGDLTGFGWRKDANGEYSERYALLREQVGYVGGTYKDKPGYGENSFKNAYAAG